MRDPHPYKRRPVIHWAAFLFFLCAGVALGGWQLLVHPDTPVAPEWNPLQPLAVTDPETPLTGWKLRRALADDQMCLAALATGAQAQLKPDLVQSAQCGIAPQVTLTEAAGAKLTPVNTRCQTALRTAMWAEHGLNPAARELFGQDIGQITHFSSYSCRAIRTTTGATGRMSTHATADAIDISGFVLTDGTSINLLRDWQTTSEKSEFLRRANNSACDWFRVTLGPRYNRLHADHFHLQHSGFGLCR
ncbi:MAG: extensin family protein [Sulfitobacter sp.]